MSESSESPAMLVANEIRSQLARWRMTQQELADALGIPVTNVRRRLSGRTDLTVNDLYAIAQALDVPVQALLPDRVPRVVDAAPQTTAAAR